MDTHEKIADIIAMVLRVEPEQVRRMSGDESLNTIGLDSLNCMDIVVQIEEEFGVTFNDEELLMDNLNSINKLSGILKEKNGQHSLT